MWKRRLAWGMFAFVLFFVFTLLFGAFMNREEMKQAEAAVLVSDANNTLQNTKTAISTATTAINTATQIANQIRNLTSMSPEGLLAHYLGVSTELDNVVKTWQAYNGLMNATLTMEQSWNGTFKEVDSFFSGGTSTLSQRTGDSQSTMRALEQTYRDSMNTAKAVSDTRASSDALQNTLNQVANANGAKEATQALAHTNSLGVLEGVKTNTLLSTYIIGETGRNQSELMEKARSVADNTAAATNYNTAIEKQAATVKMDLATVAAMQGETPARIERLRSIGAIK